MIRKLCYTLLINLTMLASIQASTPTGEVCLGYSGRNIVEKLRGKCKKGDAIATKKPAHYCDFNYAIAFNGYNTAYCIYIGSERANRAKTDSGFHNQN